MKPQNLPPILPIGTSVVTLVPIASAKGERARGVTGSVVHAPADTEHSYRVRFPDGDEVALRRHEIEVLSCFQDAPEPNDPRSNADADLSQYIIYRCVIGSRAYGLNRDASDTDRRGIYLPPASLHWSLAKLPEQIENDATQECYWELEKYLSLALKGNPNVLETLYSPIVEHAEPIAQELLAMRESFLSKLIFQTFNGYAMSQFRKMGQDIRNHGEVKWKHAMHLIRLLLSGIQALQDGYLAVQVGAHRDQLLAIRDGQLSWEELDHWRLDLHRQFEAVAAATKLPDRPDYQKANDLLLRARRMMADRERGNL